jgi:nicotinamidase-related amidase
MLAETGFHAMAYSSQRRNVVPTANPPIDLTNAVLVCIDMQQAFDNPAWPNRWNKELDPNGHAILAAWRMSGKPVIHIRHDSVDPASTLRPGQPGNQFRPGFDPADDEALVTKSVNSAFIATDLDLRLRRFGAKIIVVFGITTDQCVSTTIRTGANMGWRMVMVPDACDCFDLPGPDGETISAKSIHNAHVATLQAEFCQVVSTATLLGLLTSNH